MCILHRIIFANRMLENLDLALGPTTEVLVYPFSNTGSCQKKESAYKCTKILESVVANQSDLALQVGYFVAEVPLAAGVNFAWPVATITIDLAATKESMRQIRSDIFLKRIPVALLACSSVFLCCLVLLILFLLTNQEKCSASFVSALFWFFSILGQQGDSCLLDKFRGFYTSRALLLVGLTSSLLCLNIYNAQMASYITARQRKALTLENLWTDDHGHILHLRKRQFEVMEANDTSKLPDAWLLTESQVVH